MNEMAKLQFRVLYRQFLFRMVDLEMLSSSAHGDVSRLLGQIAALLISFSAAMGLGAMLFGGRFLPPNVLLSTLWSTQHFLIATTMLVVGLFTVLSWDTTFPDRRDVLVLAPLPIRPSTIFLAKVAALGASLGLAVGSLNGLAGLAWPALHFVPPDGNVLRTLLAYWVSVAAAGTFVLCAVLTLQGLAGELLPRRHYIRVSAILQLGTFCLFLAGYFLEPSLEIPQLLLAPANRHWLEWLPSYWFWGLFQNLNGPPLNRALEQGLQPVWNMLAGRAVAGLAAAVLGSCTAFLLAYLRVIRRIVEEPDIVPGSRKRGGVWLPRFGEPPQTAMVQFSARTLLRSRQHRLLLAFYLGIGLSFLVLLSRAPQPPGTNAAQISTAAMIVSSLVALACWVVGTRIAFSRPLEIRANWIFRVVGVGGAAETVSAARRSLFTLAVAPAWVISAILVRNLPWRQMLVHLIVLILLASVLVDVSLYGFRKIPFTCTYLPGKSRIQLVALAGYGCLAMLLQGAQFEIGVLPDGAKSAELVAGLAAAAIAIRRYSANLARTDVEGVAFEDRDPPAILRLGLNRDGSSV